MRQDFQGVTVEKSEKVKYSRGYIDSFNNFIHFKKEVFLFYFKRKVMGNKSRTMFCYYLINELYNRL